jgi:raffinose/stachyose/melibiose transport system permease protein
MQERAEIGSAAVRAEPRPRAARRRRFPIEPWLWMAPALAVMAFVFVYPVIEIFRFSFLDLHSFPGTWVGLANYRMVFTDHRFWVSLLHNAELFITIPFMVFAALVFAVLLYERVVGWRIYRSLVLVPYVAPLVAVGIAFSFLFQGRGALNGLLQAVHLGVLRHDWLGNPSWSLFTLAVVIVWRELGFGIILFLARLGSVSEEIFDAAKIDGAGWWTRMRHIIIPELSTVIEFFIIINIILMMSQIFGYVYVMTNGGPGYSTYVAELYIYKLAFQLNQLGASAVVAVILFVVTVLLIFLSYRFRRKLVGADE